MERITSPIKLSEQHQLNKAVSFKSSRLLFTESKQKLSEMFQNRISEIYSLEAAVITLDGFVQFNKEKLLESMKQRNDKAKQELHDNLSCNSNYSDRHTQNRINDFNLQTFANCVNTNEILNQGDDSR